MSTFGGYIAFPIEDNPTVLLQQAYAYIKQRAPLWQEHDGNLDTWILQACSTMASDLRILASDVPQRIFRFYGSTILGLAPNPASGSLVTSTWEVIDAGGHLIPAGTLVGIRNQGGELIAFRTMNDISILPGLTFTGDGEIVMYCTELGAFSSGLGGDGVEAELIDPLDFVAHVYLNGPTTGGVDAETVQDYMDRLALYMQNLSTRPILPADFARKARNFTGVWRAVALDGYDPDTNTYFNERMVSVFPVDRFGLDLPDQTMQEIQDSLDAEREINFIVHVLPPSRTTIDVSFTGKAIPGYNPQVVAAEAESAVMTYLSPDVWGTDPTILSSGASHTWIETTLVRYNKIIQIIENTQGLAYASDVLIGRHGSPMGTADIVLDQPAALTEVGTVTGLIS